MPAWINQNGTPVRHNPKARLAGAPTDCYVYVNVNGTPVLLHAPTVLTDASYILEEWDPPDFSQWGDTPSTVLPTISSDRAFSKTHSLRGDATEGNQNISDNSRDHNLLPRYMKRGETMRVMFYHPSATANISQNCFIRWAYGGVFEEDAYYAQVDLQHDTLRLIDSATHTAIGGLASPVGYPGGEWWALEVTWGNPTHTLRVIDYSDVKNPVVRLTHQVDDTRYTDSLPLGHAWYVWNSTTSHLYSDYAHYVG